MSGWQLSNPLPPRPLTHAERHRKLAGQHTLLPSRDKALFWPEEWRGVRPLLLPVTLRVKSKQSREWPEGCSDFLRFARGATPDRLSYPGEQAGVGAVLGDFGELRLAQTPQWTVRCQPQCPMSQWSPPGRANTPSLQRTGSRSCRSGVRTGGRRGEGGHERKLGRNWRGLRTTLCWGRNAEELETFPRCYSANLLELLPETVGTRAGRDWRAAVPPASSSGGWANGKRPFFCSVLGDLLGSTDPKQPQVHILISLELFVVSLLKHVQYFTSCVFDLALSRMSHIKI